MIWTRRKVLAVGGAVALAPVLGCGATGPTTAGLAAGPTVGATAWAGQFLWGLGADLLAGEILTYVDGLGDPERTLLQEAMDFLTEGGFDQDYNDAVSNPPPGAGDKYETSDLKAICRVDSDDPVESCLGICYPKLGTRFALEGPVLGGLEGAALRLRDDGFSDTDITAAIVPNLSYEMGSDLRFAVDSAERRYRTANGTMSVWWTRLEEGLGPILQPHFDGHRYQRCPIWADRPPARPNSCLRPALGATPATP